MKQGILLINIGTPAAPTPKAVGSYLREFLIDKYVIDIPFVLRWILVNILIVPRRKFLSAHAYEKIWSEKGSPLSIHLHGLVDAVREKAPDAFVAGAMRYGQPSIENGLRDLIKQGAEEIVIFPLYPQYAESSTRSSREAAQSALIKIKFAGKVRFVQDYFANTSFIDAWVERLRDSLIKKQPDHLLLTYHSLPERQVQCLDLSGAYCLKRDDCCESVYPENRLCYRAQCFATSRAIAKEFPLKSDQYTVSFQSRLGRARWLGPETEAVIAGLAQNGVRHLAVACPSFTADCLETIEEIGIRARQVFIQNGGQEFTFVPCLNSEPSWASAVLDIVAEQSKSLDSESALKFL